MKKIEDIYQNFYKIKDSSSLIKCMSSVHEDLIAKCETYEFKKFHKYHVDKNFISYIPIIFIIGKDKLSLSEILPKYSTVLTEKEKTVFK